MHLSKVWPNLEYLNLGTSFTNTVFNKIGTEGCLHLSKAEWPLLAHLDLCNIDPIQKATKLDPKDVSTWQRPVFPTWPASISVLFCLHSQQSYFWWGLQVSGFWIMASPPMHEFGYIHQHLAFCQLGEKAAKYLSKSCWPKLKFLHLRI